MKFEKPKLVSLKMHPTYNEKWLQEQLADDPSLLGVGDSRSQRDRLWKTGSMRSSASLQFFAELSKR